MIWFLFCVSLLLSGYFIYGKILEKIFKIDVSYTTPAVKLQDDVDYIPMSKYKVYLIQLLNIAGIGPIFGPILGALYGPIAMLWIVIGCIFGGMVHDYCSGMISLRNNGRSLPALAGKYLGQKFTVIVNIFASVLLILVGVIFVLSPAKMLTDTLNMADINIDLGTMIFIIFSYYVAATILPIDKIIGKLYPLFGLLLLFMSVGLVLSIGFSNEYNMLTNYSLNDAFESINPTGESWWPGLCITIACGAISGFHATQSPLMSRCLKNEKDGHFVFSGAMIGEGIIALIWCALALSFYDNLDVLQSVIKEGTPSAVVHEISFTLLGSLGGILAFFGVVILPISSGDTAFRACRLVISEFLSLEQKKIMNRFIVCIPLFTIGFVLTQVDFQIIWRYFGFSNQLTAVIMLWTATAYLMKNNRPYWITAIPVLFMNVVVFTFILNNKALGFNFDIVLSTIASIIFSIGCFFCLWLKNIYFAQVEVIREDIEMVNDDNV